VRAYKLTGAGQRFVRQEKVTVGPDNSEQMLILGLNAFHGDSAAALVRDGRLVAVAEEERFRRVKH
jgi:hypothetical protein